MWVSKVGIITLKVKAKKQTIIFSSKFQARNEIIHNHIETAAYRIFNP